MPGGLSSFQSQIGGAEPAGPPDPFPTRGPRDPASRAEQLSTMENTGYRRTRSKGT